MQQTLRRRWQLSKQLMVKKECNHPTNSLRHILFEIAWVIQFPSKSRHCSCKDYPKTLLEGRLSTKSTFEWSWTTIQTFADCNTLYPLSKEKEQHYHESIEFTSEHTDLFYLQTDEMDWTRFKAATCYEVWHQRLGHVPFRNIEQTIQHSSGLEGMIRKGDIRKIINIRLAWSETWRKEHIRKLSWIQGTGSPTNGTGAYGCLFVVRDFNWRI